MKDGINKRRSTTNLPLLKQVVNELKRFRKIGKPIRVADLVLRVQVSASTINRYTKPYLSNLTEELLAREISTSSEYESWHRDYETFSKLFQFLENGRALKKKLYRESIKEVHRNGKVTFSKVFALTRREKWRLSEELSEWENETGNVVTRRDVWRMGAGELYEDKSSAKNLPLTKNIVFREFDRRRKLGLPCLQKEIAEYLGPSVATISNYGNIWILELADELLKKNVKTQEDYLAWQRDFLTFRVFLSNTRKRNYILSKYLRLTIDELGRQGVPISYSALSRTTRCGTKIVKSALVEWEKSTGRRVEKAKAWKEITLPMVLGKVSPKLHSLPLTVLESPEMGRSFLPNQLRMLHNLGHPKLRNTAFLLMAFADGNRANDIRFFTKLDDFLLALDISDIDAVDFNRFLQKIHDKELLPETAPGVVMAFVQAYFRLIKQQENYLRKLTVQQRKTISEFLLPKIADTHFWDESPYHNVLRNEQITRRKKSTDVVHNKFYLLRDIADRRRTQIRRLNSAYLSAIEQHKKERFDLPYSFSILDESPQSNGVVREVRHHFQLWDAATLKSLHESMDPDFYKSGLTHQKTIEAMTSDYFLSYEGGHQEGELDSKMPYWFMDALMAKTLIEPDREKFRSENGYPIEQLTRNVLGVPDWGMAVRWWHQKIYHDLGLVFLPIEALMRMALVGHGALQIFTKSGARVNEFMQIRLAKEHLYRIALPDDHEAIVFTAMPKGRETEEPFYIDEHCLKALHDWWAYQRSRGYLFENVTPDLTLKPRVKPASFLWQYAKRHLSHSDINASIKWILQGVNLLDQDGKLIALTSHLFRHGFATELRALGTPMDILALLLKQRDVSVTDYYSKPTPAQIVSLQRKIFVSRTDLSKLHRRAPEQVKRQLDDAREKIGALIPVVGGSCTVANECPAKFACIGCAGNAPDPKKRPQVVELKAAYGRMQEMAEEQNLPAERRKAKEIMESCDDVLAEMDLIESAAAAAEAPVEIYPERRKTNERTTKKKS
jgi:hypothetical protein